MNDRDCENCIHHTKKGCKSWDCKFERKVTRKETIKVFEDMKKGIYPYDPNVYLDIAINSLELDERYELEYEQIEPCEDAISRQEVIDDLEKSHMTSGVRNQGTWNECVDSMIRTVKFMPPVTPQPKTGRCKDCKYFEHDSVAMVDGVPLIVAHEICSKWGGGCKTKEDGYCFLYEPQERGDKE